MLSTGVCKVSLENSQKLFTKFANLSRHPYLLSILSVQQVVEWSRGNAIQPRVWTEITKPLKCALWPQALCLNTLMH